MAGGGPNVFVTVRLNILHQPTAVTAKTAAPRPPASRHRAVLPSRRPAASNGSQSALFVAQNIGNTGMPTARDNN
jgi:hypothetical protein